MIDQSTIDRIIDAADVVEVVQDFVTLKRRGVNYIGNCPFHNEKTPSFTVSPSKQIFKCFGCSKGGNSVNFIMEHEHLNYIDALKYLAKKFRIEIQEKDETPEEIAQRNQRESLMIVSGYAQKYFSDYLQNENEGRSVGLSYFKERSIRPDTIEKFQLGYCPDKKDLFTQSAQKQGYKMEYLEATGLTIKREDWVRDRFSGRVIFPFHNLAGRVIAFGGRILKADPNAAKYLNSPESDIYHKSKVLYGIYQAKNEISKSDKCYLVEGYTDVLQFHQSGIENVVASSGTSLTVDQIRMIRRFTPNVTIIYDGDYAGIKASLRGIDMVLEEGINVKVVPLPQGEDPDSFAKSMSSSELLEYIRANETDFIRFKTQLLLKETENDPIARARLISDIVRSISVIPDAITRSVYIRECSNLLEVKEEILYSEVKKIKEKTGDDYTRVAQREIHQKEQAERTAQPIKTEKKKNPCDIEERALLKELIRYAKEILFENENEETHEIEKINVGNYILSELEVDGLTSENPIYQRIINETAEHINEENFNSERYFTQHPDSEISKTAISIIVDQHTESAIWSKNGTPEKGVDILFILVPKIMKLYKKRHVDLLIEEKTAEVGSTDPNDFDKIMELQSIVTNLKAVQKELS